MSKRNSFVDMPVDIHQLGIEKMKQTVGYRPTNLIAVAQISYCRQALYGHFADGNLNFCIPN